RHSGYFDDSRGGAVPQSRSREWGGSLGWSRQWGVVGIHGRIAPAVSGYSLFSHHGYRRAPRLLLDRSRRGAAGPDAATVPHRLRAVPHVERAYGGGAGD